MSLDLGSIVPQFKIKMANLRHKAIYEFGNFRLDAAHLMLYQNEQEISLAPKVIETLLALVERPGEVLGKDELMKLVWTDSIVEEGNLSQNLYLLRKTLGDGKNGKPLIETLRRRGYRFSAEVHRVEIYEADAETRRHGDSLKENTSAEPFSSQHVSRPPRLTVSASHQGAVVALADWRHEAVSNQPEKSTGQTAKLELALANPLIKGKPKYRALVAAGLIFSAIGFGYYFFYAGKTASGMDGKKTIAVLPLKPINSANRDEIYEVGIADSLIHKINSMKGFIARPLSATREYTDIDQDALTAGKEQQVDYVLASTYQLAGGKIRITEQFFNVSNGQIEEPYKSEQDAADVFAMQDAIVGEIGNRLLVRFGTTTSGPPAKRGTANEGAYRLYLDGMYLYDKRTVVDAQKAVGKLEQAIQFDPNYARAWAGKAHAHRSLGNFGGSISPHEEYRKSMEAISMALALDENLADAHSALCENKFFYEYDYDGAERECKRAVELDPNSSLAREIYSRYLLTRGRFDESISEVKTAIDLEPASLFSQRTYGICLYYARRDSEAVAQFKRVVEMDPNFTAIYHWLINTLLSQGDEAEAFEFFMKSLALRKEDEQTLQAFRTAYQTSGWPGVGRERVRRFDEDKIRSYFLEASLTAHTGDKDKAFEYLEKSYQRREWGIPYLQIDPSLDDLRADPRFDELIRQVESK